MSSIKTIVCLLLVSLMIASSVSVMAAEEEGQGGTSADLDVNGIQMQQMDGFPFQDYELRPADGSPHGMVLPNLRWDLKGGSSGIPSWANDDPANDNINGADTLSHGQNILNQHVDGTVSGTSDVDHDWYRIWLDGTATQTQPDRLNITVHKTSAQGGIFAILWDPWLGASYLDFEVVGQPVWESVGYIDIVAHMSGWYYLLIGGANSTEINYNLESVTISAASSGDGDNFMWTSPATSSAPVGKTVTQSSDHWDFYNISGMITADHQQGETMNFTATVDITSQITDTVPDLIGNPMQCFAWTAMTYFWTDVDNPGVMWFRGGMNGFPTNGGSDGVSVGGTNSEPFTWWTDTNGTRAYIGINTFSFNIVSQQLVYSEADGWADYSFTTLQGNKIIPPNNPPLLLTGNVTPETGTKYDQYTFRVTYKDLDNHPYTNLSLILNPGETYQKIWGLEPEETENYLLGSVYKATIDGTKLNPGMNKYKFKATDTRDDTVYFPVAGSINGPNVNFNDPVQSLTGYPSRLILKEDQGTHFVEFSQWFEDPNQDDIYLRVWDNANIKWEDTSVTMNNFSIGIFNPTSGNQTFSITPKSDIFGEDNILIRGSDEPTPSVDEYVIIPLTIEIESVNDPPQIRMVDKAFVLNDEVGLSATEDVWYNFTLEFEDIDSLAPKYTTNILDVYPELTVGKTYSFDEDTGEINFVPGNDMTGERTFTITIDDNDPISSLAHTVTVRMNIENMNDPPEWQSPPSTINAIQGQTTDLKLSSYVWDQDWDVALKDLEDPDMGDFMVTLDFSSDIDEIVPGVVDFNQLLVIDDSGKKYDVTFALQPTNSMVGEYDIKFIVRDPDRAKAETAMKLYIENVNDPPTNVIITEPVNNTQVTPGTNITLKASADDLDIIHGDILTYSWSSNISGDLGTGEELSDVSLPEGVHMITLTVTDSAMVSVQKVVVVTVASSVLPGGTDGDGTDGTGDSDDTTDTGGKSSGGINLFLILVIIIVIIVVVVIVAFLMMGKKEEEPGPESYFSQPPPPVAPYQQPVGGTPGYQQPMGQSAPPPPPAYGQPMDQGPPPTPGYTEQAYQQPTAPPAPPTQADQGYYPPLPPTPGYDEQHYYPPPETPGYGETPQQPQGPPPPPGYQGQAYQQPAGPVPPPLTDPYQAQAVQQPVPPSLVIQPPQEPAGYLPPSGAPPPQEPTYY